MSRVKINLLDENCMPIKKHKWDAGWDLKASVSVKIKPDETVKVHTGMRLEIPAKFCGMIVPRSGIGTKHNVTLANDVGIIDSEYRGEVLVYLVNKGIKTFELKQYDRFAQLLIVPVNNSLLWAVDKLSITGRGDGGFGSTGVDGPGEEDGSWAEGYDERTKDTGELTEIEQRADEEAKNSKQNIEVERQKKLEELKGLKPAEYAKLKNSGKLFELYPIATGDMNVDLGI